MTVSNLPGMWYSVPSSASVRQGMASLLLTAMITPVALFVLFSVWYIWYCCMPVLCFRARICLLPSMCRVSVSIHMSGLYCCVSASISFSLPTMPLVLSVRVVSSLGFGRGSRGRGELVGEGFGVLVFVCCWLWLVGMADAVAGCWCSCSLACCRCSVCSIVRCVLCVALPVAVSEVCLSCRRCLFVRSLLSGGAGWLLLRVSSVCASGLGCCVCITLVGCCTCMVFCRVFRSVSGGCAESSLCSSGSEFCFSGCFVWFMFVGLLLSSVVLLVVSGDGVSVAAAILSCLRWSWSIWSWLSSMAAATCLCPVVSPCCVSQGSCISV